MDQFMELIFDNLFFLVIIIGGIFSLFKGSEKQEEQEKQAKQQQEKARQRQKRPTEATQSRAEVFKQRKVESENPYAKPVAVSEPLSVEAHRAEQIKQLGKRRTAQGESMMITESTSRFDDQRTTLGRSLDEGDLTSRENQPTYTSSRFQKNLTRSGMIDSVVMAEVIGAPRGRKPYESVITKRKIK